VKGLTTVLGAAMVANAQIQTSTIAVRGTGSIRGQLTGEDLPLTLQFIGCIASKPTNINIIARRAARRQPEYSFAPVYDQLTIRV
jgi:hypothetical protein